MLFRSRFAILAGVFEMLARGLVGFVLVPIFGFRAACLGSPIAWIFADAFLIPAFLHVYRKLNEQLKQQEGAAIPAAGKKLTRHMAGYSPVSSWMSRPAKILLQDFRTRKA